MSLRNLTAGALVACALAACSGGEPAAEETAAAPEAAASAAPETAPTAMPTGEPSPAESPVTEASPPAATDKTAAAAPAAAAAKPAAPAPAPEVVKVAAVAAPAAYGRCAVCHTADKGGENKLGPNLYGAFGSAAGQGSFAYSDALKGSGLKWDEATLHKWLENPKALVPGNRMSFPGIKDAAKRQEIIDYLKQQS